MTETQRNSGKQSLSTEDLLNDYLKDIFGSDSSCTSNVDSLPLSSEEDEFIEVDRRGNSARISFDSNVQLDSQDKASQFIEPCSSNEDADDHISVAEFEYDLLPQERKGAIEKFCVNRVTVYQSNRHSVLLSTAKMQVAESGVKDGFYLIPIIDFSKVTSKNGFRSSAEAHLLLLNSLYFLRRPLPTKVRENFLNYGEQAIDDFHAAKWLAQMKFKALEEE